MNDVNGIWLFSFFLFLCFFRSHNATALLPQHRINSVVIHYYNVCGVFNSVFMSLPLFGLQQFHARSTSMYSISIYVFVYLYPYPHPYSFVFPLKFSCCSKNNCTHSMLRAITIACVAINKICVKNHMGIYDYTTIRWE